MQAALKPESSPAHENDVPAVSLSNVSFSYGQNEILENISLTVDQGDFQAIIGPNGGGKTTLLKLILGLVAPGAGEVLIFGQKADDKRQCIGYVPQFSTLRPDFPATTLDMVLMGAAKPSWRGGVWNTGGKIKRKAIEYLETLGLGGCLSQQVSELSGGQRQRALVARALMGRQEHLPFLLLLDEPTASIDPQGTFCFYEFLDKLRHLVTIIVVSHDLSLTTPFFSKVAFVNRGLNILPEGRLSPESLLALFGRHLHPCPLGDIQHMAGLHNGHNCSHAGPVPDSPTQGAYPFPDLRDSSR